MPLIILSFVIQVALVVHIVKTGRSTTWIWIVVTLPLAGSVAYFIVELLPSLLKSKAAQSAASKANGSVNPDQKLREAAKNFSISETVENSLSLAEELSKKGLHEEAAKLYTSCLSGAFESDPDIMHKLALCYFNGGGFQACIQCLDDLIEKNPGYNNADAHLIYARSLQDLERFDEAIHEFEALSEYFPGPEANYRFAEMLVNLDRKDEARQYLEASLEKAEMSAPHYSALHREWLGKTQRLLKHC